jgi:acyl carrier protein
MGIEERVARMIAERMGVHEDQITRQARFVEDLGANSQNIVDLVSQFEKEFAIEIPDEQIEKITTVGEAIKYIEEFVSK